MTKILSCLVSAWKRRRLRRAREAYAAWKAKRDVLTDFFQSHSRVNHSKEFNTFLICVGKTAQYEERCETFHRS